MFPPEPSKNKTYIVVTKQAVPDNRIAIAADEPPSTSISGMLTFRLGGAVIAEFVQTDIVGWYDDASIGSGVQPPHTLIP